MLALKLLLVPSFLLLVSLAGRWFGPSIAGWLAGLPWVTGPILLILALEMGRPFAASAAVVSTAAVVASMAFSLAYAHLARRAAWPLALTVALLAWLAAAAVLSQWAPGLGLAVLVALAALTLARPAFPRSDGASGHRLGAAEIALRLIAGALLAWAVSESAAHLGSAWTGLLAVFPVLGSLLAVFSHRSDGPAFVAALLRGMSVGLYGFVAFCAVLAATLPSQGIAASFALAIGANLVVQAASRRLAMPTPRAA